MHILFFTENFYRGGLDTFLLSLVNHWPYDEDTLTILCNHDHPGLDTIEQGLGRQCRIVRHGVPFYGSFVSRTRNHVFLNALRIVLSPVLQYGFFLYNVFAFRRYVLQEAPDRLMVVNGGYPGGDTCRAVSIAWRMFTEKPESIHNFHNLTTPAMWHARLLERLVDKLVLRCTRAFITVSRAAADSMNIRRVIANSGKVSFIYNGIEPPAAAEPTSDIKTELSIPKAAHLCIMLGTYEPRKGHEFLLLAFKQALQKVPDAHLVICGHGSHEEIDAVIGHVVRLGLEKQVHLLGFRRDLSSLLQASDLLLIASQSFESFGLTAVEAMAHRVPVVATWVGGLPEVVQDNDGGWCVDKDDVETYAGHIVELLTKEPLRREQGNRGFARYQRLFTAERMAREYAALIKA